MSEIKDLDQFPIITYTNRLQKQMEYITHLMSVYTENIVHIVAAVRMLISNFPPVGKEALKADYEKLKAYDSDNSIIKNQSEVVEIYNRVSDWAYICLFQDAFKFRPKNLKPAHMGSE
jgi:predicted RND superfamily exporter protein